MQYKQFGLGLVLFGSLLMAGCASVLSESSYPVTLQSTPDGATFTITNQNGQVIHSGTTPGTVTLNSGSGYFSAASYTVQFKKPGYTGSTITVNSTMDGWFMGNILLGGLIGMLIVDPITGAMWKLPPTASAQLDEMLVTQPAEGKELTIKTLSEVPKELQEEMVPVYSQ
ncbi:hypothetical protein GZ77_18100 [Endozoicomonas montiporae]|uniref:PEGA domain-containing protein n=2 Tax=Endozoicomonas montiporae TaxID=1027273 RepID=A0A081N1W6_9GAMM|nr:hypothetical protein [Endozoicomonas montiporae]AMO58611.1 hypothetical protein EZMO1_4710 [Endozoicomonas montiporae CL-33]KEQ12439.1 hypothetical protein GZ77_18100 [Endozoicomonas montiporae]